MIGFWWNFVGMDPIGRHLVDLLSVDLDLLLWVKLEINPKFFVTRLAKSRHRRIILVTWLDGYCKGPLRSEVCWRSVKYSLRYWFLNFRPKSAITRLVQMIREEPPSLHQTGVFRDGRFNGAIFCCYRHLLKVYSTFYLFVKLRLIH